MKIDCHFLGAAGELRVMSELMLKGFNPAKTYLDKGIDLILENGKTIQVKTSQGSLHKYDKKPNWKSILQYNFSFQNWRNKKSIKADFVICWAIGANIFLIVPGKKVKTTNLQYDPNWEESELHQYANNWEILR